MRTENVESPPAGRRLVPRVSRLFATTSDEVATERLGEARQAIGELRDWLNEMANAMDRRESGSFDIYWAVVMDEKARKIMNEISLANGAVLVRGIDD